MVNVGLIGYILTHILFWGQIRVDNNDLISYLVNFSCELVSIMARYDFL